MDPFPILKVCLVEPKSTDTGKKSRLFSFVGKALTNIAEGLKVPRLLEGSPIDVVYYPHGDQAYTFFFQEHFEKWFSYLYYL